MAGNGQIPYILPTELSAILATLAQYAPQIQSAATQQPQSDSYTPPGPAPNLPLYQSHFPNAVTTTELSQPSQPPEQKPSQQFYQPTQDPRLLNRSATQTPDLATVGQSASLTDLSPLQQLNQQLHTQNQYSTQYIPPQIPHLHQQQQQLQPPRPQIRSQDPRPVPQSRSSTPQLANQNASAGGIGSSGWGGLVIDPATITEWTAGLRCVNKIAAQNREFIGAIRRMITNQQKHEMQWYQGRQELKQTQARRVTGANEIHNILSSVGGSGFSATKTPAAPQQSQEEKEAELLAFDTKVYKAQVMMHEAMSAELKALGVPFFGTDADRILPDDNDHSSGALDGDKVSEQPKWSPRVTRKELLALQRRIVVYLEDMYKE